MSEDRVAYAPGRVNLIGEHTDYNDGYVLPIALDRGVRVAYRAREDGRLVAYATAFDDEQSAALDELDAVDRSGWFAYVAGVAWAMRMSQRPVCGADLVIDTDLPIGAGLSSSAALEIAVARMFADLAGSPWNPLDAARLCQRAENAFVGVPCGIMDQVAVAASSAGSALLIDCRSLAADPVPMPPEITVVVMDTGVRRRVASSEYAERRAACERAVAILRSRDAGVHALRDVDSARLAAAAGVLDDVAYRRATHVVNENARVLAAADALRRGDGAAAGRLFDESHESLRTLFEVSGPELDEIVALAREHRACFGARLTGAGFSGCAIALVDARAADAFIDEVGSAYAAKRSGGSLFATYPSAGARLTTAARTRRQ